MSIDRGISKQATAALQGLGSATPNGVQTWGILEKTMAEIMANHHAFRIHKNVGNVPIEWQRLGDEMYGPTWSYHILPI